MKKILSTLVIICTFALSSNSQTPSVTIISYIDSSSYYNICSPPASLILYTYVKATGINTITDSLVYQINWGDGNVSNGIMPFLTSGTFSYCNIYKSWTYTIPGIFQHKLVVWSKLTGVKDSIDFPNVILIGNHCDTIKGDLYQDVNNDCQYNTGEPPIQAFPSDINIFSGNFKINNFEYFQSGNHYNIIVPAGVPGFFPYRIKLANTANFYGICPITGEYSITSLPSFQNNFGFQCNSIKDFGIFFSNAVVGFSNHSGRLDFKISNLSCDTGNSTVKIILDPKTHLGLNSQPANSGINSAITGDTVTYNNVHLNVFQSQNFQLNLTTLSNINVGDTMSFKAIVLPQNNETNLSNNYDTIMIRVVASYDPNDIQVSPFGVIQNLTKLNYIIHFQNTGNAATNKVVIIDTLDANLDINTLFFKGSSHDVDMQKLSDNVVKFEFNPIYLPDSGANMEGSKGYVSFSIKPIGYLPIGTQIHNKASIYFDGNPAIQTNTVINTIDTLITSPVGINEINNNTGCVYPNPASKYIDVNFNDVLINASITIYDLSGRVIYAQKSNKNTSRISLQHIENGLYIIQMQNNNNIKNQKLIIRN
ncbi:MAG: T9SS type A sorting domain-containing protein [Bacteroidetes bacterium]|nr:T9SS type A sorting domain-containing protein [Bacteroidota bacterium]